jgi:zinc transport system substrate-binding protein
MKISAVFIAIVLAAIIGLAGCQGNAPSGKPKAIATIFAYYDALRAIGGPDVECAILLPAGTSPHGYAPTVADRAKMAAANLIVKNGLLIDNWADKLMGDNRSAMVVDVGEVVKSKGIKDIEPLRTEEVSVTPASETKPGEEEDVSGGNPHIWLDPRVQGMAAQAIRDALIKIDPAHRAGYEARARAYLEDLDKLDKDFADAAKGFKQRDFIGFHSAYAYLARRYGLNQVASVEELPGEPSMGQVGNIIKLIEEKHIKVIFVENAFPAKEADEIARKTGITTGILQPLETYDNLNQTYISLMRDNLAALKRALD